LNTAAQNNKISKEKTYFPELMGLTALCSDPEWCTVPMPSESHFAFTSVPRDEKRWREAQLLASRGEPVLGREVKAAFPHPDDFLDGDPFGQNYDRMMDIFMSHTTMFAPLTAHKHAPAVTLSDALRGESRKFTQRSFYANSYAQRAPLVQLGTYKYEGKKFVKKSGDNLRLVYLSSFLTEFARVEADLLQPSVFFAALDKDWGFLSETVAQRVDMPPSAGQKQHFPLSPGEGATHAHMRHTLLQYMSLQFSLLYSFVTCAWQLTRLHCGRLSIPTKLCCSSSTSTATSLTPSF
jgi:hypothetical protein